VGRKQFFCTFLVACKTDVPIMFKGNRIFLFKIIAIICTVILCLVQLIHIRNIYKLEEKVYNIDEKKIIKTAYEESIVNDKVFPGAVKIIDSILYKEFDNLATFALHNTDAFKNLSARLCDTLFKSLNEANNMDAFLDSIKKKHNLSANLEYALFIEHFAIAIEPNQYFTLFSSTEPDYKTTVPYLQHHGARIGGTLKTYNPQTLASALKVSATTARSYRMNFALYCDRPDRLQQIVYKTLPQTMLSVFSIIAILTIFFLTFANWIRQKKASEMKSDFINTISHEFQTPLTTIIIANKTIENENHIIKSQKLDNLHNIIKRQSERLTILMQQVIETGGEKPVRLVLEKHHINNELEEIISDYRINLDLANTNITFENKTEEDLVLLDKLHFTSIILNVLDNSVKYNHKPLKEIVVTTYAKNSQTLAISIKDNGDGMSSKVKRKMFLKFYRNPSLVTSNAPGIGLGLYHSKQCLDAHGWDYEVISKEQIGTEFIIYIPIVAGEV
jgi:two-component system phosphate regulon sensor histidine kinase PhoR